jgi:Rod binding domain-containing protein
MIHSIQRTGQGGDVSKHEAQKKRLKEACQEFESIMTNYVLKSMRESVMRAEEPEKGRDMYEGMMDETLSREMSKSGGKGLSEVLYQQLVPLVPDGTGPPGRT